MEELKYINRGRGEEGKGAIRERRGESEGRFKGEPRR